MDNTEQDNLTKKRKARILKRKGGKKGAAKILKLEKRQKKRKVRRKKIVGAVVGNTLLLPLRPFKKEMEKQLQKKGVDTKKMKWRDVVSKFYNEFVSKKGNKKSSYEPIDEVDFSNDANFFLLEKDVDYNVDTADNFALTTATIGAVVAGIINLFKKAKERRAAAKDSGISKAEARQVITETDLELGAAAAKVEAQLEEKAKEDKPVTTGKYKKWLVYGAILAVLGLVVYFVSKKK